MKDYKAMRLGLLLTTLAACAPDVVGPPPAEAPEAPGEQLAPEESPLIPETPLLIGTAPNEANTVQRNALHWVNTFRLRAGVAPLDQLSSLNVASATHAAYVLANFDLYEAGLSVHEQAPEVPGFLGVHFWERLAAVGYNGGAFREVVAYHATPVTAVAHWMETLYHRLPLIHPNAKHMGYGEAHLVNERVNVLDIGSGDGWAPSIPSGVAWPADGATQVPLSWDGLENPQPLAPPNGFPSGPVISLTFATNTDFAIGEHELTDLSTGESIAHVFADQVTDPNLSAESSVALYAHTPLRPATTYSVRLKGVVDGGIFERFWTFTTRASDTCSVSWQDCGAGKGCYATSELGTTCAWAGARRAGEPCEFQNDCSYGLTCVASTCRRYCITEGGETYGCDSVCDGDWSPLSVPGGLGACAP